MGSLKEFGVQGGILNEGFSCVQNAECQVHDAAAL